MNLPVSGGISVSECFTLRGERGMKRRGSRSIEDMNSFGSNAC